MQSVGRTCPTERGIMASVTVECHSLQDIVDAWGDGWIGCHLDKQTMKLVVEMIAAQQSVQRTAIQPCNCPRCNPLSSEKYYDEE